MQRPHCIIVGFENKNIIDQGQVASPFKIIDVIESYCKIVSELCPFDRMNIGYRINNSYKAFKKLVTIT